MDTIQTAVYMPYPLAFVSKSSNIYAWIPMQWGVTHAEINLVYAKNTELLNVPSFKPE